MHWLAYYCPDASFTFNIWNDLGYTIRDHFRLFLSSRINLLQRLVSPIIALLIAVLWILIYLVAVARQNDRLLRHREFRQ